MGGSVYDPTDAAGRLLFNVLATVTEFESEPDQVAHREGMKVAKAKGRLRGKQPKLGGRQEAHLVSLVHRRASTAPPRSPNCSVSADPRFTAPFNGNLQLTTVGTGPQEDPRDDVTSTDALPRPRRRTRMTV